MAETEKMDISYMGPIFKKYRVDANRTQEEVAERIDISNQHMSNIERAKSIPSTEVIMRLAVALETTPDEFLVGSTRRENERWRDVADSLRALNNRQLALVSSFIEWVGQQEIP